MTDQRCIALIPARGGSSRIPRKNIRSLNGIPLIAYTISAAKASSIFAGIFVSTEDEEIGRLALAQGGVCWIKRPPEMATSESPDIEWIRHALEYETSCALPFDCFAILRPTSPFRSAETIRRAWAQWITPGRGDKVDSLRAMEPVRQHPCKMWSPEEDIGENNRATSLCRCWGEQWAIPEPRPPHHSCPTQSLPRVYVQNASLEIAWVKTVMKWDSISGGRVMPFMTDGYEGLDLNTPDDWLLAEALIERGLVTLPKVEVKA